MKNDFTPKKKVLFSCALIALFQLSTMSSVKAQNIFAPSITNPFGVNLSTAQTVPSIIDFDQDGDLDMFVGDFWGDLYYYENIGNASSPNFDTKIKNPFNLTKIPDNAAAPAACDLDADGDIDLLCSNSKSDLYYFENIGHKGQPVFMVAQVNPFGYTPTAGASSRLKLIDLDEDGDFDLYASNSEGNTCYYENIGSNTAPTFASPIENPYGISDVGTYAAPGFSDLDKDGDFDLIVGRSKGGKSYFFENTGSNSSPNFELIGADQLGLSPTSYFFIPEFADIDNDGDEDLFVGTGSGVRFFEYGLNYSSVSLSGCSPYTSPSGEYTWTESGVYMDTIPNHLGCDSVMTITLALTAVDAGVELNNGVISAIQNGASYQWFVCDDNGNQVIDGETNQTFTPTQDGEYAVEVSSGSCSILSECISFVATSIKEKYSDSSIVISPNPAKNYLTIAMDDDILLDIHIYNSLGLKVKSHLSYNQGDKINISDLKQGLYIISVQPLDVQYTRIFIKK
ncbi:MAG: T9SS type A sorting domain-containing protein [Carboxylicivirga sp.]|jgi:hypothetical protein|nr:T9SS type A sorting domain-containing protein [Carboxylicivirga sp.]